MRPNFSIYTWPISIQKMTVVLIKRNVTVHVKMLTDEFHDCNRALGSVWVCVRLCSIHTSLPHLLLLLTLLHLLQITPLSFLLVCRVPWPHIIAIKTPPTLNLSRDLIIHNIWKHPSGCAEPFKCHCHENSSNTTTAECLTLVLLDFMKRERRRWIAQINNMSLLVYILSCFHYGIHCTMWHYSKLISFSLNKNTTKILLDPSCTVWTAINLQDCFYSAVWKLL